MAKKSVEQPKLRARLWIETGAKPALTEAGADLLEQIAVCHSLSEGARRLRMNYRRAWLLVDAMNRRWPEPLVLTAIGGKAGGGSKVTEYGKKVLGAYRDLQVQVEALLDHASPVFRAITKSPPRVNR
jgi:molybdate transport system regulatory protein